MSLNVTSADPISLFMIFDEIQYSTSFILQAPDYYIPMLVLAAVFLTGGSLSTILLFRYFEKENRNGCLVCGAGIASFYLCGCLLLPVSFANPYLAVYTFMIAIMVIIDIMTGGLKMGGVCK